MVVFLLFFVMSINLLFLEKKVWMYVGNKLCKIILIIMLLEYLGMLEI